MEVVKAPNHILKTKTKPVRKITPELLKIAREMIKLTKTFQDPEGVGLAATQIGRDENFFVAKINKKFSAFFNPKILTTSKAKKTFFEGCLSIPTIWGELKRPTSITVTYQDETGQQITKKMIKADAWIFQHEVDHLNGILFMDKVLEQKGRVFKTVGKDQTGADIFEEIKLI